MKRFHVHIAVDDLKESVRFYSAVFGAQPAVQKDDYAKWMLEDPRVNFAVSTQAARKGLNHLGIQVESDAELRDMRVNLIAAQAPLLEQKETSCCYAKSDKYWVTDPQGLAWEAYHTLEEAPVFAGESEPTRVSGRACCA